MIEPKNDKDGKPIPLTKEEKLANVNEMIAKGKIGTTSVKGRPTQAETLLKNLK